MFNYRPLATQTLKNQLSSTQKLLTKTKNYLPLKKTKKS